MSERERLIELIQNAVDGCAKHWAEIIADHLLANGVIVPLCKVGDTVYSYCETFHRVFAYNVQSITIHNETMQYEAYASEGYTLIDVIDFDNDDIGENVFLTREEAEAALKVRGKKNEMPVQN